MSRTKSKPAPMLALACLFASSAALAQTAAPAATEGASSKPASSAPSPTSSTGTPPTGVTPPLGITLVGYPALLGQKPVGWAERGTSPMPVLVGVRPLLGVRPHQGAVDPIPPRPPVLTPTKLGAYDR